MKDERMIILTMLQEGKITTEEAYDLLEALALSQEASREGLADQWDEVKVRLERAGEVVEEQVEKAREKIEEGIHEVRVRLDAARDKAASGAAPIEGVEDVVISVERGFSQFAKELPEALGRLLNFTLGPFAGHTVEHVYEGQFGDGVEEATVLVETRNGSVKWETWDEPGYKVVVTSKVRAETEEAARERAANAVHWEATEEGFRLSAIDRSDISSSVAVMLPKSVRCKLDTETRNGSIRVNDLQLTAVDLRTVNGSIRLEDVDADEVRATTVNGGVRVRGAVKELHGETTNGSIDARLEERGHDGFVSQADWHLDTTNGSVRVAVPTGDDIGYSVNLRTVSGRVKVGLPGFIISDGVGTRRKVSWQSEGMADKPRRIDLSVETVHGSVVVNAADEE